MATRQVEAPSPSCSTATAAEDAGSKQTEAAAGEKKKRRRQPWKAGRTLSVLNLGLRIAFDPEDFDLAVSGRWPHLGALKPDFEACELVRDWKRRPGHHARLEDVCRAFRAIGTSRRELGLIVAGRHADYPESMDGKIVYGTVGFEWRRDYKRRVFMEAAAKLLGEVDGERYGEAQTWARVRGPPYVSYRVILDLPRTGVMLEVDLPRREVPAEPELGTAFALFWLGVRALLPGDGEDNKAVSAAFDGLPVKLTLTHGMVDALTAWKRREARRVAKDGLAGRRKIFDNFKWGMTFHAIIRSNFAGAKWLQDWLVGGRREEETPSPFAQPLVGEVVNHASAIERRKRSANVVSEGVQVFNLEVIKIMEATAALSEDVGFADDSVEEDLELKVEDRHVVRTADPDADPIEI